MALHTRLPNFDRRARVPMARFDLRFIRRAAIGNWSAHWSRAAESDTARYRRRIDRLPAVPVILVCKSGRFFFEVSHSPLRNTSRRRNELLIANVVVCVVSIGCAYVVVQHRRFGKHLLRQAQSVLRTRSMDERQEIRATSRSRSNCPGQLLESNDKTAAASVLQQQATVVNNSP
jgi:hypothetical protein